MTNTCIVCPSSLDFTLFLPANTCAKSKDDADAKWEILGELALRLHHKEEAKDAFQRCLEAKFSAKALLKVLEMYSTEGDLQRTLNVAIKLTTYHHR